MDVTKLKVDQRYNWTRRNGEKARGVLRHIDEDGKTGVFAHLELLDAKGKPTDKMSKVRPSQLSR